MIVTRGFGESSSIITRGYGAIIDIVLALPTYIFKRSKIVRVFTRLRLR